MSGSCYRNGDSSYTLLLLDSVIAGCTSFHILESRYNIAPFDVSQIMSVIRIITRRTLYNAVYSFRMTGAADRISYIILCSSSVPAEEPFKNCKSRRRPGSPYTLLSSQRTRSDPLYFIPYYYHIRVAQPHPFLTDTKCLTYK